MLQRKNRFRHESLEDSKTIQAYLKAITKGLQQGTLSFADDEGEIAMTPNGLMKLKVVASKEGSRNRVDLRISWDDDEAPVSSGTLRVNSEKG